MTNDYYSGSGRAWFRVDTGTHAAPIHRVVTDKRRGAVFTAGLDKRVRRWDSRATGPQTTYIGEIGAGEDGRIVTIALHPSEPVLFVAVHRSAAGVRRPRSELRRFDVDSGGLLSSVTWPSAISDLAVDSEGGVLYCVGAFDLGAYDLETVGAEPKMIVSTRLDNAADRLAVHRSGGDVRRIFVSTLSTTPANPLVFDHDRGGLRPGEFLSTNHPVLAAQLAVSDRFLAVSPRHGGDVHIHDLDGRHLQSVSAGAGKPAELAFSPAGDRLIVGSKAGPGSEVTVHDTVRGFQLVGSRRYSDDANAVGLLDRVEGGTAAVSTGGLRFSIHCWPADYVASDEGEPAWKPSGTDGAGRVIGSIALHDSSVAIGHGQGAGPLARLFDLDTLTSTDRDEPGAVERLTSLLDRRASHKYRDRSLAFQPSGRIGLTEISTSADPVELGVDQPSAFTFLPSGRIVIGDHHGGLRVYDSVGIPISDGDAIDGHRGRVTDMAATDRWLATVGDDQIIRLWFLDHLEASQAPDLAPALNLYFAAEGEWVIWSQTGYYAASQHGDKLISFHINRGEAEEALALPASRFMSTLYRPQVIRQIWLDGDENSACDNLGVASAPVDDVLPPVVEIIDDPAISVDGCTAILSFTVTDLGPATTRVWILVDGLPVWEDPSPLPAAERQPYTLEIDIDDDETNVIRILAENTESRGLPVEWRSPPITTEVAYASADFSSNTEVDAVTMPDVLSATLADSESGSVDIGRDGANEPSTVKGQTDVAVDHLTLTESDTETGEGPLARLTEARLDIGFATSPTEENVNISVTRDGIELWRATAEGEATVEVRAEIALTYGPNEIGVDLRSAGGLGQRFQASVHVGTPPPLPSAPTTAKGTASEPTTEAARPDSPLRAGDDPSPAQALFIGAAGTETSGPVRRVAPNLYVLAVGVSKLKHPDRELADLKFAANDAIAISAQFATGHESLFGEVIAAHLTDRDASKQGVLDAMAALKAAVDERSAEKKANRTKARDVTLLFLSGHGIARTDPVTGNEDFYFVSHDFHRDRIPETAVRLIDLGTTLSQLPTELIVLIDACRSGMAGADFVKRLEPEELGKRLHAISERAQYLVSSTSHDQLSWESEMSVPYKPQVGGQSRKKIGHGLFTHAILKKLNETRPGKGVGVLKLTDDIQAQLDDWTSLKGWEQIQQTPKCRTYGDIERVEIFRNQ